MSGGTWFEMCSLCYYMGGVSKGILKFLRVPASHINFDMLKAIKLQNKVGRANDPFFLHILVLIFYHYIMQQGGFKQSQG